MSSETDVGILGGAEGFEEISDGSDASGDVGTALTPLFGHSSMCESIGFVERGGEVPLKLSIVEDLDRLRGVQT